MSTVDTRPPLRLTAAEARNWFSLHSEDQGRTIEIIGSPVLDSPAEYVEAWRGFGRWEQGLTGGEWPSKTFIAWSIWEYPSRALVRRPRVCQESGEWVVYWTFKGAGGDGLYRVFAFNDAPPIIQKHLTDSEQLKFYAELQP